MEVKEVEYESSLNQDLLPCLLHCHLSYKPWMEAIEAIHIKKLFVNWLLVLDCTHPGHHLTWQLRQCFNQVQERVNRSS